MKSMTADVIAVSYTHLNRYCKKAGACVTRGVWAKVCDSINEVLNSITLADLCREEKK